MKKIRVDEQRLSEALQEFIEITVEKGDFSPLQALLQVNQEVTFCYRYRSMTEVYFPGVRIEGIRATRKLWLYALDFLIFQTTPMSGFEFEYYWDDFPLDRGECVVTIKRVRIPKFSEPSM